MELGWGGFDRAKLDMLILIRIPFSFHVKYVATMYRPSYVTILCLCVRTEPPAITCMKTFRDLGCTSLGSLYYMYVIKIIH